MKTGDGLKDRYRKEIIRILSENPRVERIVLFGSRAMGTFTPESDIDIVLYGDDLSLTDLAQLKQALEETTIPQKVDLLLAKDIEKKELWEHIKKYGVEWWRRGKKNQNNRRNRWTKRPLTLAVQINPKVSLKKGKLYPFVDMKSVNPLWRSVSETEYRVFKSGGARFIPFDTLMARITPCLENGKITRYIPKAHFDSPAFGSTEFIVIRGREGISDNDFVYYLIKWQEFRDFAIAQMTGSSGRQRVPINSLKKFYVSLPPLPEQRAIAHILGTLDDKIELNREMNKTLEEMAQAIFKSWFIDFDPVVWKAVKTGKTVPEKFSQRAAYYKESGKCPVPEEILALFPDSFEDSELGPIPKGWRVISLYDSARYINGAAFRNNHFTDEKGALPIVKIAELKNGITGQTKFTKIEMDAKYKINTGEILLSWSGNPDTSIGTFVWSGGPAWLNQHIFRVLPFRTFEKYFVFYLLRSLKPVFAAIAKNKQTTGLGHFTIRDMKQLLIVWPIESLIIKFNEFVGPVFKYWFSNIFESSLLSSLRDTLLPKLISGELRVPDVEKFLKEAGL